MLAKGQRKIRFGIRRIFMFFCCTIPTPLIRFVVTSARVAAGG